MDSRQADQASTESRGTHTRGSMSVRGASMRGTEHPYVRPSCACLPTPLIIVPVRGSVLAETAGSEA